MEQGELSLVRLMSHDVLYGISFISCQNYGALPPPKILAPAESLTHKSNHFAHKKVRLTHVHPFINTIMGITPSNKKMFAPHPRV